MLNKKFLLLILSIIKLWVFPDGKYKTIGDFKDNMSKSILVLNLAGEIK